MTSAKCRIWSRTRNRSLLIESLLSHLDWFTQRRIAFLGRGGPGFRRHSPIRSDRAPRLAAHRATLVRLTPRCCKQFAPVRNLWVKGSPRLSTIAKTVLVHVRFGYSRSCAAAGGMTVRGGMAHKNSRDKPVVRLVASAVDWLEPQLDRARYRSVFLFPVSGVGLAAAVGLFTLPGALVFVPTLLFMAWLALVVVLVDFARRRAKRKLRESHENEKKLRARSERLAGALAETQRKNPDYFYVTSCREEMLVDEIGTTTIIRSARITAGPAGTDFFFCGYFSNSTPDRSEVIVAANRIQPDGKNGARIPFSTVWPTENLMRVFVYFDRTLSPGMETEVRVSIKWPEYSKLLCQGEKEPMIWEFQRRFDEFEYQLVLETGCNVSPLAVVEAHEGSMTPTLTRSSTGQTSVAYREMNLRAGDTRGFDFDPHP